MILVLKNDKKFHNEWVDLGSSPPFELASKTNNIYNYILFSYFDYHSLGGLGKDKSIACVSDIIVDNVNLQSTMYGARIKTWQVGVNYI